MNSRSQPVEKINTDTEIKQSLDTLTLAFSTDPLFRWLFPEADTYINCFPTFIKGFGGRSFSLGTAFSDPDGDGVSLWLPPTERPEEGILSEFFQEHLSESKLTTAGAAFEELDSYHPDKPFWHLTLIGVDPACQQNGIGSSLMNHVTEIIDENPTPAYLETANPATISLYIRYGFEPVGTIHQPPMPPLISMVRPATSK